jgi:hypothetical protein
MAFIHRFENNKKKEKYRSADGFACPWYGWAGVSLRHYDVRIALRSPVHF